MKIAGLVKLSASAVILVLIPLAANANSLSLVTHRYKRQVFAVGALRQGQTVRANQDNTETNVGVVALPLSGSQKFFSPNGDGSADNNSNGDEPTPLSGNLTVSSGTPVNFPLNIGGGICIPSTQLGLTFDVNSPNVIATPEPGTVLLLGIGLLTLGGAAKRKLFS